MTVYLVGAGPGDPGLLTRRGAALLARADVVLHDRLVSPGVLDLVPPDAEVIDVGKDPGARASGAARQDEIGRLLVEHGRRAAVVVRLKGGDPFLFGRGGEEVRDSRPGRDPLGGRARRDLCLRRPGGGGYPGDPARPGVVGDGGDRSGGRPRRSEAPGGPEWEILARAGGTLVILMGMANRAAIADALVRGGRSPETPVAVIARGTTPAQQVVRTTLAGLGAVDLGSPAVIVVGPVAALASALAAPAGVGAWPADWPGARWSSPGRAAGPTGSLDALERAGAHVLELPLTEQVDPADGGAALRAAAADVHDVRLGRLHLGQRGRPIHGRLRDARALGPDAGGGGRAGYGGRAAPRGRRARPGPGRAQRRRAGRRVPVAPRAPTHAVLFPSADIAPEHVPRSAAGEGLVGATCRGVPHGGVRRTRAGVARARSPRPTRSTFTATSAVDAFLALRTPTVHPSPLPANCAASGRRRPPPARAAGLAGVARGAGGLGRRHRRRAGRPLRTGSGRGLVGWGHGRDHAGRLCRRLSRATPAPAAPHAGVAAPGGRDPPRASTTSWLHSSCARGSTRRCPSPPCRARCSTRSTRSSSRPSGWSRSASPALILFGVPATKDAAGSGAWDPDGIVQVALRALRDAVGDELVLMADLCLDEYTDHGHCGVLGPSGEVRNDATLELYQRVALRPGRCGADVVAPSGMMDGQVAAIRARPRRRRPRAGRRPGLRGQVRLGPLRSLPRGGRRHHRRRGRPPRLPAGPEQRAARRSPRSRSTWPRAPTWSWSSRP